MPWKSKILPGKGDGNALQYSCLGNSMDRGGWWATDHEVTGVRHDWATEYAHRHWTLLTRCQLYTSFLPPRCDNHNVYRYCQMSPWEQNQQAEWKHLRHLYGSWKFRKVRMTDCTYTSSADRGWGNFPKTLIPLEFSPGISGVRQAKFCKWGKIKARLTFCWKSKHVSHNLNLESSVKISDFLRESVFCLLTFSMLG